MMFLDVCLILVGLSLLAARYGMDSGERVPVRVRVRSNRKPRQ